MILCRIDLALLQATSGAELSEMAGALHRPPGFFSSWTDTDDLPFEDLLFLCRTYGIDPVFAGAHIITGMSAAPDPAGSQWHNAPTDAVTEP